MVPRLGSPPMTAEVYGLDGLIILAVPVLVIVGVVLAITWAARRGRRRRVPPAPSWDESADA